MLQRMTGLVLYVAEADYPPGQFAPLGAKRT
jgi:hypothetical protein